MLLVVQSVYQHFVCLGKAFLLPLGSPEFLIEPFLGLLLLAVHYIIVVLLTPLYVLAKTMAGQQLSAPGRDLAAARYLMKLQMTD